MKKKLPINVTLEIVQHAEPNDRWYDVTAHLSWPEVADDPEGYRSHMGTCMVTADELGDMKESLLFIIGEDFSIQGVKELDLGSTPASYELQEIRLEEAHDQQNEWKITGLVGAFNQHEDYPARLSIVHSRSTGRVEVITWEK